MQNISTKGSICLIREPNSENFLSSFPLCFALIKRRTNGVYAVLAMHFAEDLPNLGWTDVIEFVPEIRTDGISRIFEIAKCGCTVFFDSARAIAMKIGLHKLCWLLKTLEDAGVFVVISADDEKICSQLYSISETCIEIIDESKPVCTDKNTFIVNVSRRRKGVIEQKMEIASVGEDYAMNSRPYEKQTITTIEGLEKHAAATHFESLPFDVGLKLNEKEREAKNSVQLPYTTMQKENGLLELNMSIRKKVRAGGQIVYTPEKEDDFDEDDPDEDLTI